MSTRELTEKLQKGVIRKFEKQKACSSFTDNIWGVDIADILMLFKKSWVNLIGHQTKYG